MRTVYPPSLLAMFMDLPIYFLFPLVQFTVIRREKKHEHGALGGRIRGLYTRARSPNRRYARLCVFWHD